MDASLHQPLLSADVLQTITEGAEIRVYGISHGCPRILPAFHLRLLAHTMSLLGAYIACKTKDARRPMDVTWKWFAALCGLGSVPPDAPHRALCPLSPWPPPSCGCWWRWLLPLPTLAAASRVRPVLTPIACVIRYERHPSRFASGPLAQLEEQLTLNQRVPGSSPGRPPRGKCRNW
jgi:hypothetical protein